MFAVVGCSISRTNTTYITTGRVVIGGRDMVDPTRPSHSYYTSTHAHAPDRVRMLWSFCIRDVYFSHFHLILDIHCLLLPIVGGLDGTGMLFCERNLYDPVQ